MSDPQPLVRKDTVNNKSYRTIKYLNNFIEYPSHWPIYMNGYIECDMLQGPCRCGAWHDLNEWEIQGLIKIQEA